MYGKGNRILRMPFHCSRTTQHYFMEKVLKIIIVLAVVVALGLGYMISRRASSPPTGVTMQPSSTPSLSGGARSSNLPPSTSDLTADQKLVLQPPPTGAEKEAIGRYYEAVERLAKNTDAIEIGRTCSANPIVVRVKQGTKLVVTNKDTNDHALNFDGPTSHSIRANSTETITVDFSHGPGLYAYTCDVTSPSARIVGVVVVMP